MCYTSAIHDAFEFVFEFIHDTLLEASNEMEKKQQMIPPSV